MTPRAASVVDGVFPSRQEEFDLTADVLVIGAGAAGLACAATLQAAGRSVVLLEAGSRIGGRIRSYHGPSGATWELGAQVVHDRDNPLWQQFQPNVELVPFSDSEFRCLLDGRSLPLFALARLGTPPWAVLPALAGAVPPVTGSPMAALDGLSLPARRQAAQWWTQDWAGDPAGFDVPEMVAIAAGPGAVGNEGMVSGGWGELTAKWAHGLDIRLCCPVRGLALVSSGVVARTDLGTVGAATAVVTAPPWTIGDDGLLLDGLPEAKRRAAAALRGGDAVVAVLSSTLVAPNTVSVFDADSGLGFLRTQRGSGEIAIVSKGLGAGRLRDLLGDNTSRQPSPVGVELRALVAAALPFTAGAELGVSTVADWGADPFIRGAFTSPTPERARHSAAWAAPWAGRVFFAGESTSNAAGVGRVHGALASGCRAAGQLLLAVGRGPVAHPQSA